MTDVAAVKRQGMPGRLGWALACLALLAALLLSTRPRAEAPDSFRELYRELGRQRLLEGHWRQALLYLSEAGRGSQPDPALRFLVARTAGFLETDGARPEGRRTALQGLAGPVIAADILDGGARVVATDGMRAAVFDPASGRAVAVLENPGSGLRTVRFSPDGERIAGGRDDGKILLWESRTGRRIANLDYEPERRGQGTSVVTLAFSPDGRRLVSVGADGIARAWDLAEGTALARIDIHPNTAKAAVVSSDGRWLATAGDQAALVWRLETGRLLVSLDLPLDATVASLAWSPARERVLTAGSPPVRLWDAKTGELFAVLDGHAGLVCCADFSADGALILTAGSDATARVWDADRGSLLTSISLPRGDALRAELGTDSLLTVHADGSLFRFPLPRDERGPEEIDRLVRCHVPWRLEAGRLLPRAPNPSLCAEIRDLSRRPQPSAVPQKEAYEEIRCQTLLDSGPAALTEAAERAISAPALSDLRWILSTLPSLKEHTGEIDDLQPAEIYGLIGDLHLLTGRLEQAERVYREALEVAATVKTRCGLPFGGRLYAVETGRRSDSDHRHALWFLLAVDPGSSRILERHLLPGRPLALSRDGGALAITYQVRSAEGLSFIRRTIHLAQGRLDHPVWTPLETGTDRLPPFRIREALAENFLYDDRKNPTAAFAARAAASDQAPATLDDLETALRDAALRDPTDPWPLLFLGKTLRAQGRPRAATESWKALFVGDFPAIPYDEFTKMAAFFESWGHYEWADRAYRTALERRREIPKDVTSSHLIDRILHEPWTTRRTLRFTPRERGPDRAHLWWMRTREISGASECDDLRAALWAGHFRRLGERGLAAQEIRFFEETRGLPKVQETRSAWLDYSLWLCVATLGGLLLTVPWLLFGSLKAHRLGLLSTALAACWLSLSLLSFSAFSALRWASLLIGSSDSFLLDDWSDRKVIEKMAEEERFAAAVASHLTGDFATARRLYRSLPTSPRTALNLKSLEQNLLPLETGRDGQRVDLAETARIWWTRESWRPWRSIFWWIRSQGYIGYGAESEIPFSDVSETQWTLLLGGLALLCLPSIRRGVIRLCLLLVPGLSQIRHGSVYRGYAVLCLFLFALGPSIWLWTAWKDNRPSPGPLSTYCFDNLPEEVILPPPPARLPAGLVRAYPGSALFYSLVTLSGLAAGVAHVRHLESLRGPRSQPPVRRALPDVEHPSSRTPLRP